MKRDFRVENWIKEHGISIPVNSVTGATTLTATDSLVVCDGTFTITLPAVADVNTGKIYYIKNIGTGLITLDGDGTETIDDDTTQPIASYESMEVISDGSEWWTV